MTLRFFLVDAPDIRERNEADKVFDLSTFPVTIGRGANNEISLMDPTRTVSRNHVRIFQEDDRVVIEDLESKNFTYLNNDRLNPHELYPLREGDVIQCGDFTIEVGILDTRHSEIQRTAMDYTTSDTEVFDQRYEDNPFDEVVLELVETLEQLNTIYKQITPAVRDAMLAQSITKTVESVEESNDVVQLIADSISKTGLLQNELGIPTSEE